MFSTTSHPYALQLAALWLSFMPAIIVVILMVGAQLESMRRRPKPVPVRWRR